MSQLWYWPCYRHENGRPYWWLWPLSPVLIVPQTCLSQSWRRSMYRELYNLPERSGWNLCTWPYVLTREWRSTSWRIQLDCRVVMFLASHVSITSSDVFPRNVMDGLFQRRIWLQSWSLSVLSWMACPSNATSRDAKKSFHSQRSKSMRGRVYITISGRRTVLNVAFHSPFSRVASWLMTVCPKFWSGITNSKVN